MNKIIDCNKISLELKEELKKEISQISVKLKLVVIQVGNDEASNVYIRNKQKLCEEMGILCEHKKFLNIIEEKLINEIRKLIEFARSWTEI